MMSGEYALMALFYGINVEVHCYCIITDVITFNLALVVYLVDTHSVLLLQSSGRDSEICHTLTNICSCLNVESINHL